MLFFGSSNGFLIAYMSWQFCGNHEYPEPVTDRLVDFAVKTKWGYMDYVEMMFGIYCNEKFELCEPEFQVSEDDRYGRGQSRRLTPLFSLHTVYRPCIGRWCWRSSRTLRLLVRRLPLLPYSTTPPSYTLQRYFLESFAKNIGMVKVETEHTSCTTNFSCHWPKTFTASVRSARGTI